MTKIWRKEEWDFENYCRLLYDENCEERWEAGQTPYPSFKEYYNKHKSWLKNQYKSSLSSLEEKKYYKKTI
jgi:hypothetical protein